MVRGIQLGVESERDVGRERRQRKKGRLGKPLVNNGQGSITGMGRLAGERELLPWGSRDARVRTSSQGVDQTRLRDRQERQHSNISQNRQQITRGGNIQISAKHQSRKYVTVWSRLNRGKSLP